MSAPPGSELLPVIGGSSQLIHELPVLVLNIHSRCNCRCMMCDIWRRDKHEELRAAALDRHRDSLRRLRVERVVFSGGEPLMHSELEALCRFFAELGIRMTLLTTGLLLERRATCVADCFEDVIVSLDGPARTHDEIRRVPGAFDAIARGVRAVKSVRSLPITARMTVQKLNFRHLSEAVRAARQLGLDGISLLAADLTSQAFNRPSGWTPGRQATIELSEAETAEFAALLERFIADHDEDIASGYIAEDGPKLRRMLTHFRAHLGLEGERAPRCNAPWVSAVVETDGSVRPCFFHPAVANFSEAPLEELVNGPQAIAFRENLDVSTDPVCRRCVCSLWLNR